MKRRLFIALALLAGAASAQSFKWSEEKANAWYAKQPWLVGANYLPATAVNQLEMWQGDTFDDGRVDLEFIWAENLGMNTMRVFLHDLVWKQDQNGFKKRIERFLSIAKKHHIRPIFVLFDSCWDPFPEPFHQRPPQPGIHNSRWVQSPGMKAMADPKQEERFLDYVANVILAFADDDRILAWDVWNEPDNLNGSSYGRVEPPNKLKLVEALLPKVFQYARSGRPTQPLTSGVWQGDWSSPDKLTPIQKIQLEQSDIISFHSYDPPEEFEKRVQWLQQWKRPILCTEYMARPRGSTFEAILPIAQKHKVAAINWGFVAGKSQTWLPWDSWQQPYSGDRQPKVWFHDIFRINGTPYIQSEVDFIKNIISGKAKAAAAK
jgi:cellulase (glycosyl hydrolase family 5)